MLVRNFYSLLQIPFKVALVIHNLHSPAAKDVGRAYKHGVSYSFCLVESLAVIGGASRLRLEYAQLFHHGIKAPPVLGYIHVVRGCAEYDGI